jgi:integrase
MPLPHDNPKMGRALTEDEVRRLLDRSPPPWRDIGYAYFVTGLRRRELTSLTFRDIDRPGMELVVRPSEAKNHRVRRVPIDAGLAEILRRQEDSRKGRKPGTGKPPAIAARVRARFSREHVLVITQNTPAQLVADIRHQPDRPRRRSDVCAGSARPPQSGVDDGDLRSRGNAVEAPGRRQAVLRRRRGCTGGVASVP